MSEPIKDAARKAEQQAGKTVEQAQDAAQRAEEAGRQTADESARAASEMGARAEQVAKEGGQAAERASTAATSSARDVMTEWMSLMQQSVERNMEAMSRMARCRTPQDVMVVQSDLITDNLISATETARRMSAASMSALRSVSAAMTPPNLRP